MLLNKPAYLFFFFFFFFSFSPLVWFLVWFWGEIDRDSFVSSQAHIMLQNYFKSIHKPLSWAFKLWQWEIKVACWKGMDSSLSWARASCRCEVQRYGNVSCDRGVDCNHLRAVQLAGLNSFSLLSLQWGRAHRRGGGLQGGIWWWVPLLLASRLLRLAAIACALGCDGGVVSELTSVTRPYPALSAFWQRLSCWSVTGDMDVLFLPSQLIMLMRWEGSWDSMSNCSYHKPTPTVNCDKAHLCLINGIFTVAVTKFKNCCDNIKLFWRCFLWC